MRLGSPQEADKHCSGLRTAAFQQSQFASSRAIVILIFSGLAASNCKIGDSMEV
jgi:hypothetical protein